eukprot:TRINITY_DN7363_c0_g1_i1.p1 TRINITY_DN7363_c0_g1~~TRINITY_DN7363_c0_g1_i1.p1  ORF type:complete len:132 (-),score=23.37 TRINITY_DN7363_c0_g1_i1:92-487(-)
MASSYNPDRAEVYDDPNDVKVTFERMTQIPHATKFYIKKEDHTFGNIIRMELLRHPDVRFAGYRVPHPLDNHIELTIQTNEDVDAVSALVETIGSLRYELQEIRSQFEEQSRSMGRKPAQDRMDYQSTSGW